MAGIGFDLRHLVEHEGGMFSRLRAYAAAGVIAAGPWIVTMASLWLVRVTATWLSSSQLESFLSIVGAVFAASLVTVSGLQMAVTRYLADALYVQRYGGLLPAFATCTALVAALQAVSGTLLCWWLDFSPAMTLATVLLYVSVSLSWLGMAWLTVIRQHDKVLLVYLVGGAVFLAMLMLIGSRLGLVDVLTMYAVSNGLIVVMMSVLIARGVEVGDVRSGGVIPAMWQHRVLLLTGTVYGLSLWIDKWLFWVLDGVPTIGALRQHPLYDSCFYLGYLTVVPAMAVNLVHLETKFYEVYRAYYGAVTGNQPLARIRQLGQRMAASLRESAASLIRVQGGITVGCVAFAPWIIEVVGLPEYAVRVFRFACIGAFCHVLLLIAILVMLYFDRRKSALRACTVFLVTNALLAWWSVSAGPYTYGAGFAVAALAGLLVALWELRRTFSKLEYLTFMRE